jgi:hypothetical protein
MRGSRPKENYPGAVSERTWNTTFENPSPEADLERITRYRSRMLRHSFEFLRRYRATGFKVLTTVQSIPNRRRSRRSFTILSPNSNEGS